MRGRHGTLGIRKQFLLNGGLPGCFLIPRSSMNSEGFPVVLVDRKGQLLVEATDSAQMNMLVDAKEYQTVDRWAVASRKSLYVPVGHPVCYLYLQTALEIQRACF